MLTSTSEKGAPIAAAQGLALNPATSVCATMTDINKEGSHLETVAMMTVGEEVTTIDVVHRMAVDHSMVGTGVAADTGVVSGVVVVVVVDIRTGGIVVDTEVVVGTLVVVDTLVVVVVDTAVVVGTARAATSHGNISLPTVSIHRGPTNSRHLILTAHRANMQAPEAMVVHTAIPHRHLITNHSSRATASRATDNKDTASKVMDSSSSSQVHRVSNIQAMAVTPHLVTLALPTKTMASPSRT